MASFDTTLMVISWQEESQDCLMDLSLLYFTAGRGRILACQAFPSTLGWGNPSKGAGVAIGQSR